MLKPILNSTVNRGSLWVVIVFAALLACATQARATLWNWNYQSVSGCCFLITGFGTLTTTGASSPFTITSITGDFNNEKVLNVVNDCCGGALPADNLLYTETGLPALLSLNGMAFETFFGS